MSDGRSPRNPKDAPKPTWTDRSVPESVMPETGIQVVDFEDVNALVPAADPVVQAAYNRTGNLPTRPVLARGGADALVIQRVAKQVRVLNFRAEGIHWRAGFAPEPGQTPIGQYVPGHLPPEAEVQTGTGFVLRPIDPALEGVLRDIVPPSLLKLEGQMFGRHRDLGGCFLYFIPNGHGALVGILAWYLLNDTSKSHLLYLQTEVQRADLRILDEMEKTFRASFIAKQQVGEVPAPFNFWEEIAQAGERVELTLKKTSQRRLEVAQRVNAAKNQAEDQLYHRLDRGFGQLGSLASAVFVRAPQLALVGTVRVLSKGAVRVINAVDRLVAPKREFPDDLM